VNADSPFRLFVVTGETSGDNLAAAFIRALAARITPRPLEVRGVGGPALEALGVKSLFPQTDIQLMGVLAVLKRLPTVLQRIAQTAEAIIDDPPDLLLTVDAQDFAMRVTRRVRKEAPTVPIVHWVAPTVWAWRPGRAKAMAPHVDRLLALLPFEPEAFARLGGPPTTYVGHPLLDQAAALRTDADDRRVRDNAAAPVILVLPGSRGSEIRHLLPVFREAVKLLAGRYPHARFLLPAVPHLADGIEADIAGWPIRPTVLRGDAAKQTAFRHARAALAASGTVTLELALAGIPHVGAYRGNPVEAWLARRLVRSHSVLMSNLVLGRNVVPELLQEEATPAALAASVGDLVPEGAARAAQLAAFAEIDARMARADGRGAAEAAVDVALELLASKASTG
jgi:lipid-A-disaccharide synthase